MVIFNRVFSRDLDPKINHLAKYGLGVALEKLEDRAAALEHFWQLKRENIEDEELRDKVDFSLGRLLLYINHEEEGRSLLKALLARTNDNRLKSKIHTAFGHYHMRAKDRKRARDNFTIALKYFPDNLQAELARAEAKRGSGGAWAAYNYYDDYLVGLGNLEPEKRKKVDGRVSQDLYESGIKAYRSGNYHSAISYFSKVLARGGEGRQAENSTYWMAESYASLGKNRDAISYYDRVLKNVDTSMDQAALIKKGIILFREGRREGAASAFHRAVEDYPHGTYTRKALEWKRETEAQIREDSILEKYNRYDTYTE